MKVLVTGGGGFLGSYLVDLLLARGDTVSVLCRGDYPVLRQKGVTLFQADLADRPAVIEACSNQDWVFHVGAKAGFWGKYDDYYRTNVLGTQNVLDGCQQHHIKKLVYTSSPSVVFDGKPLHGVDESVPYASHPLTHYQKTKAEAEQLILKANGKEGVITTALRPHLIWGPQDNHIIPRVIARARAGKLKQVGDGKNKVGNIYVENAAKAHLQAAESEQVAGKAYFITQDEPICLWDWIRDILEGLGIAPIQKSVSLNTAMKAGALCETLYKFLPGEPPMTRFLALQLGEDHYFDISRAQKDFGFSPEISHQEGMKRLLEYYRNTSSTH